MINIDNSVCASIHNHNQDKERDNALHNWVFIMLNSTSLLQAFCYTSLNRLFH